MRAINIIVNKLSNFYYTAYIQRYEKPETILEEDNEQGSYVGPLIINGKVVLNKPDKKKPSAERNKHIYENEQVKHVKREIQFQQK